jgi:hypothetical protein
MLLPKVAGMANSKVEVRGMGRTYPQVAKLAIFAVLEIKVIQNILNKYQLIKESLEVKLMLLISNFSRIVIRMRASISLQIWYYEFNIFNRNSAYGYYRATELYKDFKT